MNTDIKLRNMIRHALPDGNDTHIIVDNMAAVIFRSGMMKIYTCAEYARRGIPV